MKSLICAAALFATVPAAAQDVHMEPMKAPDEKGAIDLYPAVSTPVGKE